MYQLQLICLLPVSPTNYPTNSPTHIEYNEIIKYREVLLFVHWMGNCVIEFQSDT